MRKITLLIIIMISTNISINSLDNKIFYYPKIDNLNIRESPCVKGKITRLLEKGEVLEFIEKGQEEIINDVKGNWIKIKTEKGEIGWCFDAYLEQKINNENKKIKSDLEIRGYKGKIKEIIFSGTYNSKIIDRYDINGNLIEKEIPMHNRENEIEKFKIKWDENGNSYSYNEKGEIYETTIYKYNEKGNIIEVIVYAINNLIEYKAFNKYENNRLIESKNYHYEKQTFPSYIEKDIFVYDKDNLLIEILKYYSDSSDKNYLLEEKNINEYRNNIKVKTSILDKDGNKLGEIIYKYDEIGNEIEYSQYILNKEKGKLEFGSTIKREYVYW